MKPHAAPLLVAAAMALAGPAAAGPLGFCAITMGDAVPVPCRDASCRCLSVGNACPFPVNAFYETGDGQRSVRVSAASVSREACADARSPGTVRFLAWRPDKGYPLPGQPVPMDGASMTGPVPEAR